MNVHEAKTELSKLVERALAGEDVVIARAGVLVSSVSGWEIAIKRALGKLDAPRKLAAAIDDAGFVRRLIRFEDCEKLQPLPSFGSVAGRPSGLVFNVK